MKRLNKKQGNTYQAEYKAAFNRTVNANLTATHWGQLKKGPNVELINSALHIGDGMKAWLPNEVPSHLVCVQSTTIAYVMFRLLGIPVEVVIGDILDGEYEGFFYTDPFKLLEEHRTQIFSKQALSLHAWLQLDNRVIADFAGHKYLAVKGWRWPASDHSMPAHIEDIKIPWRQKVKYKPMLIGAELLCSLQPSPLFDYAIDQYNILKAPIGEQLIDSIEDFWMGYSKVAKDYIQKAEDRLQKGLAHADK